MTVTSTDPAAGLSTGELETELLGLAGNLAAAQCRFLQLLAEFDERHGWAGPGLKSCAHWLCWRIGMSLRTAAEHVRVAHALRRLPKITAAFAAGRISYSKVRAITRIAGQADADDISGPGAAGMGAGRGAAAAGPDVRGPDPAGRHAAGPDASSLGASGPDAPGPHAPSPDAPSPDAPSPETPGPGGAAARGPADLGAAGSDARGPRGAAAGDPASDGLVRDDVAEEVLLDLAMSGTASHVETVVRATRRAQADPQRTTATRSLSWRYADDGALILRGRFTPDDGALLVAAVDALITPRQAVTHPVPDPPEGWQETGREQEPGAAVDRVAARRADALLALVVAGTDNAGTDSAGTDDEGPVAAHGRAQVVVHIEVATGTARIEGGPEIPAATAERLACDADAQVLLQDCEHNRLYLGRRRRLASPAQIAALTVRDGAGCRFPGCSHTRYLHAHHVRHWLFHGNTDLDNLVLLCSFHHRLVHDLGYRIDRAGGRWLFARPDGTPVPEAGAPLDGNTESLLEINTRAGLRIARDGLTPSWGGERLDPNPILQRLLPRPRPDRRPAAA